MSRPSRPGNFHLEAAVTFTAPHLGLLPKLGGAFWRRLFFLSRPLGALGQKKDPEGSCRGDRRNQSRKPLRKRRAGETQGRDAPPALHRQGSGRPTRTANPTLCPDSDPSRAMPCALPRVLFPCLKREHRTTPWLTGASSWGRIEGATGVERELILLRSEIQSYYSQRLLHVFPHRIYDKLRVISLLLLP